MLFKYNDWFSFDASYGTLQFHLLHNKNHWSLEVTHSPLFHIKGWIKGVKLILNIHTHTFFSCMCCLVLQVIKIFLWCDFLMFRKEFFYQILALLFGWKYRKGHSYKWLYHKSYILKVNNLIYIVLLSTRICFDKTVFTWTNCTASVWFPR